MAPSKPDEQLIDMFIVSLEDFLSAKCSVYQCYGDVENEWCKKCREEQG